jgi:hypothetical protein
MINEWWALLSIAGLGCWIGCLLIFIYRAFPRRDMFQAAEGLPWGLGFVVSFAIWIIGMLRA